MTKGKLILIPTPIEEEGVLHPTSLAMMEDSLKNYSDSTLFAVEDHKPGRRRWIKWGLPREWVDELIPYNEHGRNEECPRLIEQMKKGKTLYLMSDGGMPAFCDPGTELVNQCHQSGISIHCGPIDNSLIQALALSGFSHAPFYFAGFPPSKKDERVSWWDEISLRSETTILMDTPYRMKTVINEVSTHLKLKQRQIFLGMDLSRPEQKLWRGRGHRLKGQFQEKREFVLVISS